MKLRSIHPFPARMAPEIALEECRGLPPNARVLDPMAGSGTVLRVAAETGHSSVGCDLDPLAVLISSAWTSGVPTKDIVSAAQDLVGRARALSDGELELPWMQDPETTAFIAYWFAASQREALARLSACLADTEGDLADVLRVCLSRLIIAKERGASLARDVSHSRPHKVRDDNDFDVMGEFVKSAVTVTRLLSMSPLLKRAQVVRCDARRLTHLDDASFDAVITSPPYLNAIDYMRGHKMALVWLGYSIPQLREIRSSSVGSERGAEPHHITAPILKEVCELPWYGLLPSREASLVRRYIWDICALMQEIGRVLKNKGKAVLVVGNSCLRGVYIENSRVVEMAAGQVDLRCTSVYVRDLPSSLRYLPMPERPLGEVLGKRMRKEFVLSFAKA